MSGTDAVTILSASESWDLLSSVAVGRLVTNADGRPEIFPVNFVVQNRTVLFRTAEGTKLVSAVINNEVLFEADAYDAVEGWSVIVRGRTRTLRSEDEIEEAERAGLKPWTPTVKAHYVRIAPIISITGRRFRFGPEPASG
ncbi:MAG: pyridoxamine 5'-phosphate oxidase family protein [Candidatus Sericytochromatia bacterium]